MRATGRLRRDFRLGIARAIYRGTFNRPCHPAVILRVSALVGLNTTGNALKRLSMPRQSEHRQSWCLNSLRTVVSRLF